MGPPELGLSASKIYELNKCISFLSIQFWIFYIATENGLIQKPMWKSVDERSFQDARQAKGDTKVGKTACL
jgi:hypothetical protein